MNVKMLVAAIVCLIVDFAAPVVDLGLARGTIAGAAGVCGMAGGMGGMGPCGWAPMTHYGLLAATAVLGFLAVKPMIGAKKTEGG